MSHSDELHVLLVEDNPGDVRLIREMLKDAEPSERIEDNPLATPVLTHEDHLSAGLERLESGSVDVILLDLGLPDSNGFDTLDTVLGATNGEPIVVLTGIQDEKFGIEAVKQGAQDYLVKGEVTSDGLIRSLHHAIDRKEYEQKLQQKNEELAILHRVVRHDIRNEMSLVIGRGQSLTAHVDDGASDQLETLLRASNHVIELTRTVGDLVESITGEDDVVLKSINVGAVIRSELEKARSSNRNAEFTIEGDVPDADVEANEMLSSVFGNLFANAVRHNDKEVPRIRVDAEVDDGTMTVHVADNGPGIPDEWKDEIFGRGEKGLESPGTGIGLYLVHKLVDQYGGDVWVADNEPEGSVFSVQLVVS